MPSRVANLKKSSDNPQYAARCSGIRRPWCDALAGRGIARLIRKPAIATGAKRVSNFSWEPKRC